MGRWQAAYTSAAPAGTLFRIALGEPRTNRELFDTLVRHGYLATELGATLSRMTGFRNVLVHGYYDIDLAIVEDVVRHRLGDLLAFVAAISKRL